MYFFSIIIPIFNTEKFLSRCIFSILNQSFSNYEIICVNDNSPGNCSEIIKQINSNKIIYIENEKNLGTHLSRMKGVEIANSKYCLFLDSDDYYITHALEILYDKLSSNPIDQLEFGYDSIPYHNQSIFQYDKNKNSILDKVLNGEKSYTNFSLCNKITKTDILKEAFSRMDKFYCIWFEDGYEQFYISSICKSFDSLKKNLLILDETSGITTTNKELSAEKFLLRCQNVRDVLIYLNKYIEKYNLQKYLPVLDNSWQVHPAYLIRTYLPTVKKSELSIAIKGLFNYFPDTIINENINKLFNPDLPPLKLLIKNKIKRIFKR